MFFSAIDHCLTQFKDYLACDEIFERLLFQSPFGYECSTGHFVNFLASSGSFLISSYLAYRNWNLYNESFNDSGQGTQVTEDQKVREPPREQVIDLWQEFQGQVVDAKPVSESRGRLEVRTKTANTSALEQRNKDNKKPQFKLGFYPLQTLKFIGTYITLRFFLLALPISLPLAVTIYLTFVEI